MDRASSLPDDVLCHILSFLTTKEAALTSALSKRWLDLWTLIPNLDIDDSVFLHPEEGNGERDGIRQSFVEFVDRVLALQGDSPIKKFSLKCITGVHPDCVNRWIGNVLQRGVLDLNLFIDFSFKDIEDDDYYLPKEMFVSKTLVELKIRSERYIYWWTGGEDTFLPMLKSLDLNSEMICLNNKIEILLPSFPVLEELRIAITEWVDSDEKVSSASLKKLSIHTTYSLDPVNPKSISFDTPNLLYLNYSDYVAEDYPLVNMKALVAAQINLMLSDDQTQRLRTPSNGLLEDDEVLRFGNVVKLMNGIQNVQLLCFSADTLEVLSLCCDKMPVFNNVKSLVIKSEEDRGWQALPVLLRKCPHLEALIFEGLLHFETDKCGDACNCIPREDKCRSLASCPVKRLEVRGFKGKLREIRMIRHFLESFTCLKDMWIFPDENGPIEFKVLVKSELVTEMMYHFNELSSCDVYFLELSRS